MGFFTVLALIFIALKLTHVIAWSWLWVTSPFWIGGCLWLLGMGVAAIMLLTSRR